MASKIRRWLRELAVWLLIGAAVSLAVDYFRQPALPQNVSATSLQTLDGRTLDLHAMSQQKPLLLYVWATWCGVCRYTTPSVASLAADSGNVLTVALRSGDKIQVTPTLVVISQGEVKSVTTGWTSGWGMRLRLWLASW
ncbi:protein disulfide oxidoreductase [Klebsiella pneumoniae]|nr:protein disulfide oxidoreductase [Klebsiella pneumoniae]